MRVGGEIVTAGVAQTCEPAPHGIEYARGVAVVTVKSAPLLVVLRAPGGKPVPFVEIKRKSRPRYVRLTITQAQDLAYSLLDAAADAKRHAGEMP